MAGWALEKVTGRARYTTDVQRPGMLHAAILPHHTKWMKLFENLRYVVIDELHQYRGVFGSHVANVIRRLLRLCAHYGSKPVIVCCSATIANPSELAAMLTHARHQAADILHNIRAGVITIDAGGHLVYANPSASQLVGVPLSMARVKCALLSLKVLKAGAYGIPDPDTMRGHASCNSASERTMKYARPSARRSVHGRRESALKS